MSGVKILTAFFGSGTKLLDNTTKQPPAYDGSSTFLYYLQQHGNGRSKLRAWTYVPTGPCHRIAVSVHSVKNKGNTTSAIISSASHTKILARVVHHSQHRSTSSRYAGVKIAEHPGKIYISGSFMIGVLNFKVSASSVGIW